MIRIDIRSNVKEITRQLDSIQRKQIPFATSSALNNTARDIAQELNKQTTKYIDRPTSFTQRAFGYSKSNKRNLTASVFAKDIQAKYLRWIIYGGIEKPKKRAHVIPVRQKRNVYGNIPKGAVKRLLARSDTFSGEINGVAGIWQRKFTKRKGGTLKLLFAYEPTTKYKAGQFPIENIVRQQVAKIFPYQFDKAFEYALRTAR